MRKLKLIMTLVAIFVIANFVSGANPAKKDYTKNLANNMVKHLCKDVTLTDSQKVVVQTLAREYETNMKDLNQQANSDTKKTITNQVVLEYRSKLESVLKKEQIDTLEIKRIERLKSAINTNKTKNK